MKDPITEASQRKSTPPRFQPGPPRKRKAKIRIEKSAVYVGFSLSHGNEKTKIRTKAKIETAALKKKLDTLKRKRTEKPEPKPRKKPSKGPKTNIEYEYVPEPAQREMLLAK